MNAKQLLRQSPKKPGFCDAQNGNAPVAKIVSRRRGEDEIFFRLYQEGESLDIVEPADWSIHSRGSHSDAYLDIVILTSTGDP